MKKFKFLTVLLFSFVMAMGVFAFGACDNGNGGSSSGNGGSSTGDSNSTDSGDSNSTDSGDSSGGSSVTADTDPETIVSQKLTKEQWQAALQAGYNAYNFSVKGFQKMEYPDGEYIIESEIQFDEILYIIETQTQFETSMTMEGYIWEGENGEVYGLIKNPETENWEDQTETFPYEGGAIEYYRIGYVSIFPALEDKYSEFSYDEELNAYVAQDITVTISMLMIGPNDLGELGIQEITQETFYENFIIKFADGKVCYIYLQSRLEIEGSDSSAATSEMLFYDYGTTQVTLPEISE